LPIEIAFLARHGIPIEILRRAADLAAASGASADETLIRNDLLDGTSFYRTLAAELNLSFIANPKLDRAARFPHNALYGVAPLASSDGPAPRLVLAPTVPALLWLLNASRPLSEGLAVTTPAALGAALMRARAGTVIGMAANDLAEAEPKRSYRDGATLGQTMLMALATGIVGFCGMLMPGATLTSLMLVASVVFFAMVLVRLAAAARFAPVALPTDIERMDDRDLPVYTVIVPLYRERRVFERLIRALTALDYPAVKLDIKLVIEADDVEMRATLGERRLPGSFEVLVAPPGLPRTKPRALNVALPLARGEFTVVYDAEDVPDPLQLRHAVAAFAAARADVACLQARLVIDNTDDNWLTRFFTIEYATLFDVINPGLAAADLPIPLGGTSNHFRTAVLQELHGWDAWNVTEDADLGLRLALAGYRVSDLPSSTREEAPVTFPLWMRQRTRWMKGFMQVIVSHSRHPVDGVRRLGPLRFFAAVTMTLGTVATALGYPLFIAVSIQSLAAGTLLRVSTTLEVLWSAMGVTLFVLGLLAMIAPAVAALHRRRWVRKLLPFVPLLPFYYALITAAAWRGLFELLFAASWWHKTEHGLARTSRAGLPTEGAAGPAQPPPADGSG
jgi:cellulose synthase/poly-beta-1,6-N-acetylglucosamine synthase-like glycosyltransferase